jgi:outer membrane protein assembly factor BamD
MKTTYWLSLALIAGLLTACSTTKTPSTSQLYRGKTANQIFAKAETELTKRSYTDAAKTFEALISLYPAAPETRQARLDVIYAHYQSDEFALAVTAADRYIQLYPQSAHTDYAYYLKGLADEKQGETWLTRYFPVDPAARDLSTEHRAFTDYQKLVQLFPASPYAQDARERMIYLRDMYARYELSVADYYMQRQAYVAAANRATYILQHYQGVPTMKDALIILVRANRALGLNQAADEAQQVLNANYLH